jgi:hypothetical protein
MDIFGWRISGSVFDAAVDQVLGKGIAIVAPLLAGFNRPRLLQSK